METVQELVKYGYDNYKLKDFIHYKENGKYNAITFEKTINDILYLSEALIDLGLKDKNVIIVGENSYEWMISWVSIIGYVGVALPIDKMWTSHDLRNILNNIEVSAIIHSDFNIETIEEVKKEFKDIKYINIKKQMSDLLNMGEKLSEQKNDKFSFQKIESNKVCEIRYSGGTTSFPKAITLTQKNLLANMENMLKRAPMNNNDKVLIFLPLHHAYSSICAYLYSFYSGLQNYIGSGLNNLAEDLKLVKPTILTGVPLIYYKFLEKIDEDTMRKMNSAIRMSNFLRKIGIDLRKVFFKKFYNAFGGELKYWFCAGSFLKLDVKKLYSDMGIRIQCAYGLTECSSLVALEYYNQKDVKSAGIVLENQEVKILEPNEKGEGEILVKGEHVTPGYYNNDKLNNNVFIDGFFKTGDIGKIDKDNNIYIVGRKKRVIIGDGGKNIYPDEIEEMISKMGDFYSVKVYEESNNLCAQLVTDMPREEIQKIIEIANSNLAKYMQIKKYDVKSKNDMQVIK